MLVSGYFRLPHDIPKPVWRYPMSYISFHFWALQVTKFTQIIHHYINFEFFFPYSRFTIVKHEYINNNIRFLPGSIPERFEWFNIRQPNTRSSKDTWRVHLGVCVPDRREKIKMDRFKRDLKHDHHIPHYFLHHDQDQ